MSGTKKPEIKTKTPEVKTPEKKSVKIKVPETNKKENPVQETPEERKIRLQRIRERREQRRKRRQRAIMIRIGLAAAVIAIVIGIICGISALFKGDEKKPDTEETIEKTEPVQVLEAVGLDDVLHLSFQSLIADTQIAFSEENTKRTSIEQEHLTVAEYEQVLQQLYDKGYMLIRLQDLVEVQEDGTLKTKELMFPQGKKPLIISQQNVSYSLDTYGQGLPTKLILSESGKVVSQVNSSDGSLVTGAYDIVPCLDAFVESHPDFSYEGARGILGISGVDGVLGYRTDAAFATSENNKYASEYGTFDTTQEMESLKSIVNALKTSGWEFACSGYQYIAYQQDKEKAAQDLELWKTNLADVFGTVEIFLYPFGTDIGDSQSYTADNEIYALLKEQGFRYFCALDLADAFSTVTKEYVRCNFINLDGYRMYQEIYQGAGRFSGILDFTGVYDGNRPAANQEETSQEESTQSAE